MPDRADNRGAVLRASLLDAIVSELKTGRYPGGPEVAAERDSFVRLLSERESAGVDTHSSFLFVFPENTESISVTGDECALDCAHCGGHYLRQMTPLDDVVARMEDPDSQLPSSLLISGGCDGGGRVPLPPASLLRHMAEHFRLNLHVGLADDGQMAAAARFADAVSFDMVGSDRTIRRVMGLRHGFSDYLHSFRRMQRQLPRGVEVVPHIVAGLDGGEMCGEYGMVDALANDPPGALVLLVLRPTPGTRFASAMPPPLAEVADLMRHMRRRLPKTQLHLGCMRPSGMYRPALDLVAAACDFDVLVQPTQRVRRLLVDIVGPGGIHWADECCALFAGAERPRGRFSTLREFRATDR